MEKLSRQIVLGWTSYKVSRHPCPAKLTGGSSWQDELSRVDPVEMGQLSSNPIHGLQTLQFFIWIWLS